MTYDRLKARADGLSTTTATPAEVAQLLSLSRQTYALSFFAYDLLHFALLAALMAMEAAIRQLTGAPAKHSLAKVIDKAVVAGILTPEMREVADDFRMFRNPAAHPDQPFVVGAAGTMAVMTQCHDFVGRLYPVALPSDSDEL